MLSQISMHHVQKLLIILFYLCFYYQWRAQFIYCKVLKFYILGSIKLEFHQ